jgi:putative spermidine/putrescine transport system substrate-binding protein
MKNLKQSCLISLVSAVVSSQAFGAGMVTELGKAEGQVSIVAWPGYIERGETIRGSHWLLSSG